MEDYFHLPHRELGISKAQLWDTESQKFGFAADKTIMEQKPIFMDTIMVQSMFKLFHQKFQDN